MNKIKESLVLLACCGAAAIVLMAATLFSISLGNPLPMLGALALITGILLRV